jgi:hypothetical protein
MKKIFFITGLVLLASGARTQTNYSGAYGYSFKPGTTSPTTEENTGPSGRVVLLKMDGNKYRFWLDVTIGPPSYNAGETDGTITFVNDTASFDNTYENAENPCILKFKITDNTIKINSQSTSFNCGFGNGVNADGDYAKLKVQPLLNNDWLRKEYLYSPTMEVIINKAELYKDENCLYPFEKRHFFIKGDELLRITETEKTVYTEYITSTGKFIYGWMKKTAIQIVDLE